MTDLWFVILSIIHVLVSVFLIVVILMQAAKGHGLAGAFGSFGGGMAQNLFGGQAADMLTKITNMTAVLFVATSITLAIFSAKRSSSIMTSTEKPAAAEKTEGAPAAPSQQDTAAQPAPEAQDAQPAAPEASAPANSPISSEPVPAGQNQP